ncbi:MAG: flagellar basal-body MS-ring/collar protein FliF [Pseudomonadales bacterium]|jgi:flagellar M-ring protein FliF|nr:flagellar basal-body MS-ring/collar protein FliF [Pseudomonadales bacterium]
MAGTEVATLGNGDLGARLQAVSSLPAVRQVGLLVGLAAAVAIGVGAVLWAQEPTWRQLHADLPLVEQGRVLDALGAAGIDYRLGAGGNAVMVPAEDLYRAQMQLAQQGLPESAPTGYELLDQDTGFGASRRMESARFQRALEGELTRSIESLRNVRSARIHLALPERSVFLRERTPPSASVVLNLYAGRSLTDGQIEGIRHLVAASVPELASTSVTVLDQNGRLLSPPEDDAPTAVSGRHLALTRELETTLVDRIEAILAPIVGADGVRAQVAADLDFTRIETTSEIYDPEARGDGFVRSERLQNRTRDGEGPNGVPGALTNQPPEAGVADPNGAVDPAGAAANGAAPQTLSSDVTRNYEIDKRIEYARSAPGRVRRLSVAVVVDQLPAAAAEDPEAGPQPRTPEELARLEALIREAVGFDAARGDTISVTEAAFARPEAPVVEEAGVPLWEQPWLWSGLRQLLGATVVIVLLLTVLRPFLKSLATLPPQDVRASLQPVAAGAPGAAPASLPAPGAPGQALPAPAGVSAEERLNQARSLATEDPRRVAQLTRAWMESDG